MMRDFMHRLGRGRPPRRRRSLTALVVAIAAAAASLVMPSQRASAATIWTNGCVSGTAACLRFNQGSNYEYGYTNVPGVPSAHLATKYGGLIGVYQIRNRGYVNPFLAINSSFTDCLSRQQDSSTWRSATLYNGKYISVGYAPGWGCHAV